MAPRRATPPPPPKRSPREGSLPELPTDSVRRTAARRLGRGGCRLRRRGAARHRSRTPRHTSDRLITVATPLGRPYPPHAGNGLRRPQDSNGSRTHRRVREPLQPADLGEARPQTIETQVFDLVHSGLVELAAGERRRHITSTTSGATNCAVSATTLPRWRLLASTGSTERLVALVPGDRQDDPRALQPIGRSLDTSVEDAVAAGFDQGEGPLDRSDRPDEAAAKLNAAESGALGAAPHDRDLYSYFL